MTYCYCNFSAELAMARRKAIRVLPSLSLSFSYSLWYHLRRSVEKAIALCYSICPTPHRIVRRWTSNYNPASAAFRFFSSCSSSPSSCSSCSSLGFLLFRLCCFVGFVWSLQKSPEVPEGRSKGLLHSAGFSKRNWHLELIVNEEWCHSAVKWN